jgi:hypothetical protein
MIIETSCPASRIPCAFNPFDGVPKFFDAIGERNLSVFSKYLGGAFPAPAPPAFLGIGQIEYLRLSL